MSLYWPKDSAAVDLGNPRLHAFIVGVGEYKHLGIGAPKPAKFLSGLAPLTTTTLAAKKITRWLETNYINSDCPLGSIELLLSPSESLTRSDGTQVLIDEASMGNIEATCSQWYARCNAQRSNVALFYFAGHGISTLSHFLLAGDFGDPSLVNEWKNCINFSLMQTGMVKCAAQTQVYFVDACRDSPIEALIQRSPSGNDLVGTATFQDKVELSAAYFAASEGRQAFGRDDEETFFCKALIMCLEGVGARKVGPTKWRIDAASLSSALVSVIDALAANENLPLSSDCRVQKPIPLHYPTKGSVVVTVVCESDQANLEANIRVKQGSKEVLSPAGDRRPWIGQVEAGDATIEVNFATFASETITDQMTPPTYPWTVPR